MRFKAISYLGFVDDKPVICAKYLAKRYASYEEACAGSCYIQGFCSKLNSITVEIVEE